MGKGRCCALTGVLAATSRSIDINVESTQAVPGLFDLIDRDQSGFLDQNEMEALAAELEARRRVAEKEVWSRLHLTERDLFKIQPLVAHGRTVPTGIHGLEFASPHCSSVQECADVKYSTTLRISSWSEWLGEYLRVGQSRHKNVTTCSSRATPDDTCGWHLELQPLSHVHVDGTVQGSCPLELSGGSASEKTSICIDRPTETRTMLLPDASGMVLTTTTRDQIPSLVGLRGNRPMQFTGESHSDSKLWKYGILAEAIGPTPPLPRLDCASVNCSTGPGASRPRSFLEFGYAGGDVWHAVDERVWLATRGKWFRKLPAYFTFACPEVDPHCDIFDHGTALREATGVEFVPRRAAGNRWYVTDGYNLAGSAWPQLDGDWRLADQGALPPWSKTTEYKANPGDADRMLHWLHQKGSEGGRVLLLRQKRNGFEGGISTSARPELASQSCAASAARMALPLHPKQARARGVCEDLEVPGAYGPSFCDDAPKWWNLSLYPSSPYRRKAGTVGDGAQMRYGVTEDDACCVLGGGTTEARAYDWLRVYYREGAYRRAHPRPNVTGLGRTGLLHTDATDESEWGVWLRAGQGPDGLIQWVFNLLEPSYVIVEDQKKLEALSCCPRPPRGCPMLWDGYGFRQATDVCEHLGAFENSSRVGCRGCARHVEHARHSVIDTRLSSPFSTLLYSNLTELSTMTASGTEALPLVREYFKMLGASRYRIVSASPSLPTGYEAGAYHELWKPTPVDPYAFPPQKPDPGLRASDMWHVTGTEECFACCYLASPHARDELPPGPEAWQHACQWVEITGAQVQVSVNGFYQKLEAHEDPGGQGRPAYQHTSGRFFLYFLARVCMHEEPGVCPRRGPGWVVGDVLGRDSARLLAFASTDAPADVVGNYWYEWNGTTYDKPPDPEPVWSVEHAADGTVNATFFEGIKYEDAVRVKVMCAPDAPIDNHLPMAFWGSPGQRIRNFTTTVGFVDGTEHSHMSLPDSDGTLLSTGNLEDISRLGTLKAPITAQSGEGSLTQVRIGLGWQTVNVTEASRSFRADVEMGGFRYCYVPRSVCYDLCNDPKIGWEEGRSCRDYGCLFPLPLRAFNLSNSECPLKYHSDLISAAAHTVDAIIIEGPPRYGEELPALGSNPQHFGKLLYFPIFGGFASKGFCRGASLMNDAVGSAAFDEANREALFPRVNGSRACRPIEYTTGVNEDRPPLEADGSEGDCLTTNWGGKQSDPASCRAEPFRSPLNGFIQSACDAQSLKRQPVCVPEYSMVRWGVRDDRASPKVGELLEVGPPRLPVTGLRWSSVGGTRPRGGRELFNQGLSEALSSQKTTFRLAEWSAFDVSDLRIDDYIQAGSSFFKPVGERARLRVDKVLDAINTTNPYLYAFEGGGSSLPPVLNPTVKMPTRITTYLSTTSMHVLSFVGSSLGAQHTFGEAVVLSSVSYRARPGQHKLESLVLDLNQSVRQQVDAGRGRPVLLEVQLERSGRGWHKHTKGVPVPYATEQERQDAQASHLPAPLPIYGYGSAAQLEDSPGGDAQAASDVEQRARGLASYDAEHFFPHLQTRYAIVVAGVSNASGHVHPLDRVVVHFAPEFMPREEFDPLKARSLLELLNLGHPQVYGGGPDNASDVLAFGPFQPHLPSTDYAEREALRKQHGWVAGAQAGFATVRGFEPGQRGQVLRNNTIHLPSSADGIALATSNLGDVKDTSTRMTSLAINARRLLEPGTAPSDDADAMIRSALRIGGWLQFGSVASALLCS